MPDVNVEQEAHSNVPEVTALTGEQEKRLRDFVASWTNPQRNGPIDRQRAEAAIARRYKSAELPTPPIIWCESPYQVMLMQLMLVLKATDNETGLHQRIANEISDPLWQRMWQKLQAHIPELSLNRVESLEVFSLDTFFGEEQDTSVNVEALTAQYSVDAELASQLSLKVKLKLRQAFRGDADTLRADFMGRNAFARTQFGIMPLSLFAEENLWNNFIGSLSRETKELITSTASKIAPSAPVLRFGVPTAKEDAIQILFEKHIASRHLRIIRDDDLRQRAFVLTCLPVQVGDGGRHANMDMLDLKENTFHIDSFEKICFLCEAPLAAKLNENNQLHNPNGPAIEFADGSQVYAWNGVIIPAAAIIATDQLTIDQIDKETNVEIRRVLIQQYGLSRYLSDTGAVPIDVDEEYGVLYRKSQPNDEPINVVRVKNPTPEPDGTFKEYFLRVPPHITTARSAVAWTFDMNSEDYEPATQT